MINPSDDNVERFYRALYAKVEYVVLHQGSLILMKWNVTTVLCSYKKLKSQEVLETAGVVNFL